MWHVPAPHPGSRVKLALLTHVSWQSELYGRLEIMELPGGWLQVTSRNTGRGGEPELLFCQGPVLLQRTTAKACLQLMAIRYRSLIWKGQDDAAVRRTVMTPGI